MQTDGGHTAKPGVLVCCCCITSDHSLSGFRHPFILIFLAQESGHSLAGSPARASWIAVKVSVGCILSGDWGPLPSACGCWQNAVPLWLKD